MDSSRAGLSARVFWAEADHERTRQVQEFRKRLFVDRLRWKLETAGNLEVDEFDGGCAMYAALYEMGVLVGTFRIIRTDEPYLAEVVFPNLAVTRGYPKSPESYEISRFGVWPSASITRHAPILYALMFHFALVRRATSLVAVTDLIHERYLARRNIRTRRFGMPVGLTSVDGIHHFRVVAGEIPIAKQQGTHLRALLSHLNGVAIYDETLVLGRQRLSVESA